MKIFLNSVYVSRTVGLIFLLASLSSFTLRLFKVDRDSIVGYIPELITTIGIIIGIIDKKSRYTMVGIVTILFVAYFLIKFIVSEFR